LPAGGNNEIGQLIADAMAKVGRQGVVTMEESKTAEDNLVFVEGMQFDRGYYSPYFVTDPERMVCEYENCRWGRRHAQQVLPNTAHDPLRRMTATRTVVSFACRRAFAATGSKL
jgi:hypothetical protein